jgi:DHA1 family bicyclomycin/chloramphenicol resistance-like MFS transporter
LLLGFALFVVASLAGALVTQFEALLVARFLQAAGVSVGTVCSRAIVRDLSDEAGAAQANAYIAAAMGVAPIIGPVLGGLSGAQFGPQSVFFISALIGLAIWVALLLRLPESRPAPHRVDVPAAGYLKNYAELLKSGVFVGYTLMFGFGQGIFFAFMAVGAPVFDTYLDLGQREFGLVWAAMAVGYVACAMLCGRLARRFSFHALLLTAALIACAAGWTLWAITFAELLTPTRLIGLLSVLIAVNGIITPLSLAGAVNYRPKIAGTASGLSSSLGLVLGGGFTILAGGVYDGDFLPVSLVMAGACTMTAAMVLLVRNSRA